MALPCFMLSFCIPMLISGLFPSHFRLPFRVSSFPPRHPLPPLTYTLVEDVIAVDGSGGLEFRQAWRYRYEASRVMRKMLRDVALFWGTTGILIAIALIIVAWMSSHDVGYGVGYGIPWLWAFVSTGITIFWVRKELDRERREWGDHLNVHREKPLHLVESRVDREAFDRMLAKRSATYDTRITNPTQYAQRHSDVHEKRRTKSDGEVSITGKVSEQENQQDHGSGSEKGIRTPMPGSDNPPQNAQGSGSIFVEEFTEDPEEYEPIELGQMV